jgi:hypothetical protein
MAVIGNDEYTPSGAANCEDQLLSAVGNTDCANEGTLELAEINILHLDEKSAVYGEPKNPITGWTLGADNETEILTWRTGHSNTTASKVRTYYGTGEKPEPTETTITLRKNKVISLGTKHMLNYTIQVMDNDTYDALRALQANKGQFHAWFCTDSYLYGGDNGIICDVEKVVFTKAGGRGDVSKCIISLSWSAKADPVRDALPYQ